MIFQLPGKGMTKLRRLADERCWKCSIFVPIVGWSATPPLPDYGRIARQPESVQAWLELHLHKAGLLVRAVEFTSTGAHHIGHSFCVKPISQDLEAQYCS